MQIINTFYNLYYRKISPSKTARGKDFKVGEKVMAVWHNNKRYPAQITKVLEPGNS